ncbi:MAG TPA: hypothetical protein VGQ80_10690, partial [Acidimicrobiia bacterium]|nr:hypothetical protein [Acidimicrobiia bacterium]
MSTRRTPGVAPAGAVGGPRAGPGRCGPRPEGALGQRPRLGGGHVPGQDQGRVSRGEGPVVGSAEVVDR